MKRNKWIFYSIYAAVLIGYIVISKMMLLFQTEQRAITYDFFPLMNWSAIIFILLGVLLGLEQLILEARKKGPWKINLPKIILLGIPSLYFAIGLLIFIYQPYLSNNILVYPIQLFIQGEFYTLSIIQMIFGYVIVTSFDKVED